MKPSKEAIESAKTEYWKTDKETSLDRIVSTLEAAYSIDVAPLEQRIQDLEAERDRLKQENEQLNDVKIPCVHVAQDVAHSRCIKCNYDSAKAGMQYAHARLSTAEKLLASI